MSALGAAVAAHAHVQDRGVPPVGYVSQAPDHRVAYDAFAPTLSAAPVLTHYLAGQDGPIASYTLTHHFQSQAIQAREGAQVREIKGSIGHVEVFQMDGVGTPIIGRPRPLPGHDTPNPAYHPHTLNYEEPLIRLWVHQGTALADHEQLRWQRQAFVFPRQIVLPLLCLLRG